LFGRFAENMLWQTDKHENDPVKVPFFIQEYEILKKKNQLVLENTSGVVYMKLLLFVCVLCNSNMY